MFVRVVITSALLSLTVLTITCWGSQPLQPAVEWVPEEAAVVLEITDPQPLMDLLLDPQLVNRMTGTPYYRELLANQEFKGFWYLVLLMEARFSMPWRDMLEKLVGGGITLAIGPQKTSALLFDATDGDFLRGLHGVFLTIAQEGARSKGEPEPVTSTEYRGVTGWVSTEGKVHAVIENRFLVASDETVFKSVIDQRSDPKPVNIAKSKNYLEAIDAVEKGNVGRLFVDLKSLNESSEPGELTSQPPNALEVLLTAGMREAFRHSDWMVMGLQFEGESVLINTTSSMVESEPDVAAFASSTPGVLGNFTVQRQIAGLSLYRDLRSFYAAKEDLFPDRTSGLIFFENMMGIFFSGRDFTDDVLAELDPEIRLVVAQQDYPGEARAPGLQIPAFATILRMKNPDQFSSFVEEAWQKALGLLNFTRGQQAEPGLIIDRAEFRGVKYTYAYFAESPGLKDSAPDTRYNFRPALAMPGDHLILSSTDQLARDLIEAVLTKDPAEKRLTGVHSYLEVDISETTAALEANSGSLIQHNMLKEGSSRQEAENEVKIFLLLLQQLGAAQLRVGRNDGGPWSELEIAFASD